MSTSESALPLDREACYRAVSGRDARWDGRVYLGVLSTGIYCRPSCPARTPKLANCRFFGSAAGCVAAGFRACKRCRPDAVPGTRDWDTRGDLVARAVRRIRDGAVDAAGVPGLAAELSVSERHLRRMLRDELGAGPLQLARTRRAHAARALIEQTALPLTGVAYAAGFGSLRQFGDTMRAEFGVVPSAIPRGSAAGPRTGVATAVAEGPTLALRLRTRSPFDPKATRAFLVAHAIPGRDDTSTPDAASASTDADAGTTAPTAHAIDVPGGTGSVRVSWGGIPPVHAQLGRDTVEIPVQLTLPSLSDTLPAIQAVRRMLDLDADPAQLVGALGGDDLLGPLIARRPGLRLPGARDPHEFALATVLGQQVSLAAARTLQGRLVAAFAGAEAGGPGETPGPDPGRDPEPRQAPGPATSPGPDPASASGFLPRIDVHRIAGSSPAELRATLRITGARAETLHALATALAAGLDLGPGADRDRARAELAAIRGIGPWTVELVAMRALGDPDAYPAGDLILRRALGADTPREAERLAASWRPFRGYATQHLWADFLAAAATGRKDTA